jgi:hypothetical protein
MFTKSQQKKELERLRVAKKTEQYLKIKTDDFLKGIQDTGTTDILLDSKTTAEKLGDSNYMSRDVRNKVYKLFNNDAEQSEDYIKLMNTENISAKDFNVVYPQLMQLFQGTLASASDVAMNTLQLIVNFQSTGNFNQSQSENIKLSDEIDEMHKWLNSMYNSGSISREEGNEGIDALNVIEELNQSQMTNFKTKGKKELDSLLNIIYSSTTPTSRQANKVLPLLDKLHDVAEDIKTGIVVKEDQVTKKSARIQQKEADKKAQSQKQAADAAFNKKLTDARNKLVDKQKLYKAADGKKGNNRNPRSVAALKTSLEKAQMAVDDLLAQKE